MKETVHIRLDQPKIKALEASNKDLAKKIKLFHTILHSWDHDWPYISVGAAIYGKDKICVECGGKKYNNPLNSPQEIKALARQLGIPIKIKRFALATRCFRRGIEPVFEAVVEA